MINLLYITIPFTKIRISTSAVLVIAAMFYADFSIYTALVLISAFLHEAGHLIAMKIFGVEIYSITVLPFGAVIRSDASSLSYRREATVALSGAAVNLACAASCGISFLFINNIHIMFFGICNLFLAAVNLIPVKSLDGARALEAILYMYIPIHKVRDCMESVSYFSFVVLTVAALVLLSATGCNFSLVIMCVYLFICVYVRDGDL